MAIFIAGAAFAADTSGTDFRTPTTEEYAGSVSGGTVASVVNAASSLTAAQSSSLQSVLASVGNNAPAQLTVAEVVITGTNITYAWADGELLWNDVTKTFVFYTAPTTAEKTASGSISLNNSDYNYAADKANGAKILSVKGATGTGSGSSGGCSVLTLGALALFLAPVAVIARKKAKK